MRRSPMLDGLNRRLFADPKGPAALIRRLLTEHGRAHWRRYCLSLAFMSVGAACTALPALLFGRGIDQAYVYRSFDGVAFVAVAMIVIFVVKGLATYGQAVTMARIRISPSMPTAIPRNSPRGSPSAPGRRRRSSTC
jgi:ABC-type multidrug transport system fused ATPase/permease subunit